jgi:hypothetical protein
MRDLHLPRRIRLAGLLALAVYLLTPGIPARAAGSTPVSACGTINAPGNYVVIQDLVSSGDCLTLTVSNIAIDLHGHKIKGDGTGAAITDGGNSIAYIIVANGKITNFATGIDLSADNGQTADLILSVNASGNAADGINILGRDNNLSKVTANNNGGDGVVLGTCCDSLFKVTTNGNGGNGVHFASEDSLLNVTANGNGGNGVSGAADSFVVKSLTNNNGGNGVGLAEGDNLVISSVANGNHGDGINLDRYNQATGSTAGNNQGDGIRFQAHFGLATSVITRNNASDGVLLTCPGSAVRVAANGNAINLEEDTSGGTCTNVRNKAP